MESLRRTVLTSVTLFTGFVLLAAPADAALGDVLHSIPTPGQSPADLAWVDGVLYSVIFSPTEERGIYCVDPETGDVLGTVPYAGSMPQGLAYDGHNLWQVCLTNDRVYKLDPLTGEIRDSFAAPGGTNGQPIGLGWDGAWLWLGDSRDPEKIWQLDTLGTVQGQIPTPGDSPYGLDWAEGFIWVSDNNTSGLAYIYKVEPSTGAVLDSFPCPGGGGSPNGITFDGENLWVAVLATHTIYEVDDGIASAVDEPLLASTPPLQLVRVSAEPQSGVVDVRFAIRQPGEVRAQLFDILGRQRAQALMRASSAGLHEIRLARADLGSGIFLVRVRSAGASATGKVLLTR